MNVFRDSRDPSPETTTGAVRKAVAQELNEGRLTHVPDDLLSAGFQLAAFIVPNRTNAIQILIDAADKLQAQFHREKKRKYWRDKYLKRSITRITKSESDTLQWLIYLESERYEKQVEQSGECTVEDLVVHYVKHLVRITIGMSCFYVNIGLHRLLYDYTMTDVQCIYEALTERYRQADLYRRVKALLVNQMRARFGEALHIVKRERGDIAFEALREQRPWISLVEECLNVFTPWTTREDCRIIEGKSLWQSLSEAVSRVDDGDPNKAEIRRCHVCIEPACFNELAATLRFAKPNSKLAVPRFAMNNDETENGGRQCGQMPPLTEYESREISGALRDRARRRRSASPALLRIRVDSVECARLALRQENRCTFAIEEGSRLIEIWTENNGEEFLLATQFISYDLVQGIRESKARLLLRRAGELELNVVPRGGDVHPRKASIELLFHPAPSRVVRAMYFDQFAEWLKRIPVLPLAVAGVVLTALILGGQVLLSSSRKFADYTFAIWIGFSIGLVLLFGWAALINFRRRRLRRIDLQDVMPFFLPVDLEILREALNSSRATPSDQAISSRKFQHMRRERRRLAAELLRRMSHNAALLQDFGYSQLRSTDAVIAAQAQELIDAGLHVRLYAFWGLALLFVRRIPGFRLVLKSSSLIPAYESLRAKAEELTSLRDSSFREALARSL